MKKYFVCVLAIVCVLALCACGTDTTKPDDSETPDVQEELPQEEEKVITITTPYANICVPERFEGNVTHEIVSEKPYTLTFRANDGTELFTLVFGGTGDILMGTLVGETENTVMYMNIPELDKSSENYAEYCTYQEAVNTIMGHLTKDYTFHINELVEVEDNSTTDIRTDVVTLKYPAKWKDVVQTEITETGVKFSNNGTPLFDLIFSECDGYLLGTYKDTPIYIVDYPVETDEQAAMQEDVNVILQYLMEDPKFTINH